MTYEHPLFTYCLLALAISIFRRLLLLSPGRLAVLLRLHTRHQRSEECRVDERSTIRSLLLTLCSWPPRRWWWNSCSIALSRWLRPTRNLEAKVGHRWCCALSGRLSAGPWGWWNSLLGMLRSCLR